MQEQPAGRVEALKGGLFFRAQWETTTAGLYRGASDLWSLHDTGLPAGPRLKSETWPAGRPGLTNAPAHLAQENSSSQSDQAWTENHGKDPVSTRSHKSWLDFSGTAPDVLIIFCLWYEIHHGRRILQGKVLCEDHMKIVQELCH